MLVGVIESIADKIALKVFKIFLRLFVSIRTQSFIVAHSVIFGDILYAAILRQRNPFSILPKVVKLETTFFVDMLVAFGFFFSFENIGFT